MPDLLTHYAVSYLVASRVIGRRRALLLAFTGLAPDVDALLGLHRWATHSLLLTAAAAAAAALVPWGGRGRPLLLLAMLLYGLHIILDTFTAPTPLLWPLTAAAYAVHIGVTVAVGGYRLPDISPRLGVTVAAMPASHGLVEGPAVDTMGIVVAVAVAVATALELATERRKGVSVPG